ncbi:MAG: sensor histidine kinase [Oligoflexales bacterium]
MAENDNKENQAAPYAEEEGFTEALAATSRLATLGELTASIVHEINNPLLLIQGYADILSASLESGHVDPKKFKKTLEKISDSVSRITKIVGNIRSFARSSHEEELKEVIVNDLVHEAVAFCQKHAEQNGVLISVVASSQDLRLQCRPVQISQVIVNFVNNAVDAVSEFKEKWMEIVTESNGNDVVITITDSGNGIKKEIQEKIMKPFFTTKSIGKGTGLGLSISQTIINSHGGKITIDNSCRNTRFVIRLPKTAPATKLKSA